MCKQGFPCPDPRARREERRCDTSRDRREEIGVPAECALLEMRPKAMSEEEAMRYDTPVLHHSDSG